MISKFNPHQALYVGGIVFILTMSLLVGFTHSLWILVSLMAIGTIGELIMVPASQSLMADLIPDNARSSYMAVSNIIYKLGFMFGSLSVTIGHFLNSWQMVIMFVLIGLVSLLVIFLSSKQNSQK